MNQLILEDDGTCQLQSFRTILDFPVHERPALNHGCRQVGPGLLLEEEAERKKNMHRKQTAAFLKKFLLSLWCCTWVEMIVFKGYLYGPESDDSVNHVTFFKPPAGNLTYSIVTVFAILVILIKKLS